jgi:thiamin-phosphate kinase
MKISELGEIKLLDQFVLDKLSATESDYNNDCVSLPFTTDTLLWSIDPCPTPVATNIGYSSPEILGWYTAIINISDIAACGGVPEGFLVSVELTGDTEVEFYERFNIGLSRALDKFNTKFLGGNLKAASKFSATGTIIGKVQGSSLTRLNTKLDDSILVIGQSGFFWAGVLQKLYNKVSLQDYQTKILEDAICYPIPNIDGGKILKSLSDTISCMDSSDGVINCCYQLAKLNDVTIEIQENIKWQVPNYVKSIYEANGVNIDNGCSVFGDWQLVCSVEPCLLSKLEATLKFEKIDYAVIGKVTKPNFDLCRDGFKVNPVHINQNFSGGYNSINNTQELIEKFLYSPLFIEPPLKS